MNTRAPTPRLPYMPGLDGLRALAVLAVFLYHLGYPWAAGGFLGVETFFVLSGYLITALLLQEYASTGRLNLKRFWLRRARRLWPALWLLLAGTLVLAAWWAPDAWPRLRQDWPAAFVYGLNILYIVRQIPYFARFGRPPLLQHLWSLGVEEQFYLIWPLLLLALLTWNRGRSRYRLVWPLGGLALAATFWMAALYDPLGDPARVYYAPDTRAAGFAVGALLAVLWPPGAWPRIGAWADIWGGPALIGLLAAYHALDEFRPWLYRGGFLLTALLSAGVLSAATQHRTWLGRLFGQRPLVWLGTRSYAFYLWHWPWLAVWRPGQECTLSGVGCALAHFGLTAISAELSYRFVEHPIRRRGVRSWWADLNRSPWRRGFVAAGAGLWVLAVAIGLPRLESQRAALLAQARAAVYGPQAVDTSQAPPPLPRPSPTPTTWPSAALRRPTATALSTALSALATTQPSPTLPVATPTPGLWPERGLWLTLLGDSIMAGTRPAWEQALPPDRFYMWAAENRRLVHVLTALPDLAAEGHLAPVVVIHTGTNGPFAPETFDQVMQNLLDLGVRRVYFVNVRSPIRWAPLANERLAEGVARWPQAQLLDWNMYATPHLDEWFYYDGAHLNSTGARAYVAFILRGVGLAPYLAEVANDASPTPQP